jgi:hypothetical protein
MITYSPSVYQQERRQFLGRDRSVEPGQFQEPPDEDESELPVHPFSRYRGLAGVQLPKFHGKYTEDVNAWLTIVEHQFHLTVPHISSKSHCKDTRDLT